MRHLLRLVLYSILWGLTALAGRAQSPSPYCVTNLGGQSCRFTQIRILGTALNPYQSGYCRPLSASGQQYSVYPVTNGYTAALVPGATYQVRIGLNQRTSASLWLDANGNGVFEPSEWQLITNLSPATLGSPVTISWTVPPTARLGRTRLRVRAGAAAATDACTLFTNADTRDFTVTLVPAGSTSAAPYCDAPYQTGSTDYEYIDAVVLTGTALNNPTGVPLNSSSYYHYPATGSTTARVERGQQYTLYAYTSNTILEPRVGVWVDWNQNQQFEASEYQPVVTPPPTGTGYHTTTLLVPATAALGTTRMRVRARELANPLTGADACTTFIKGETEDYTITVAPAPAQLPPPYNPAPAWSAAQREGDSTTDGMNDVAVDSASGAIYALGYFQYSIRFGTLTATSGQGRDGVYLTKFNANGQPQWLRTTDLDGPSTYSLASPRALTVDAQGNVYVIGTLSGNARFGPGVSISNQGGGGVFLAKYNAAGTALWAQMVLYDSEVRGLSADAQGNIALAGRMISKYSPQGNVLWQRNMGSTEYDEAVDIAALPGGDFAVVVNYKFPFTLDGIHIEDQGMALLRLSPTGALRWARTATGQLTGKHLRYDRHTGDLIVAGSGSEGAVFDPTTGVTASSPSSFIARYRANGAFRWQRAVSGNVFAAASDNAGGAYLSGSYDGPGRFGGITVQAPLEGLFVAHYDSAGVARWVANGTSARLTYATGLGLLPNGTLVVGGTFNTQLTLSPLTLTGNATGYTDSFLARLRPACTIPVLTTPSAICAGDSLRLRAYGVPTGATLQWSGPNGFSSPLATPLLPAVGTAAAGTYTLVATAPGGCSSTSTAALTVVAPPAAPLITPTYQPTTTILTSSAATGNQWYYNGQPIVGATATTYVVTGSQLGSYTVTTTSAAGCTSAASAPLVVTGARQAQAEAATEIYPNPTPDGRVWIRRPAGTPAAHLAVHTVLGQLLTTRQLRASTGAAEAVELGQLPPGIYVLLLRNEQVVLTRRLVVK